MSYVYDRCSNCMNPYDGSGNPCPYCGQDVVGYVPPKNCLPPFTILQGKYMIGRVLGQGGFGITYIGYDMNLATYVAIKEYYPESISGRGLGDNPVMVTAQSGKDEIYNKNLNRFVDEARNLSRFYSLPGIVSVRNFFYDNGTAYIVMDYVAGDNLKKYLADNGGKVDEGTVLSLMKPVLESLYEIHKQGLIHRDISPDNIMFDVDGTIKLIDFGAVRGSSAQTDMTYTVMLKHGYAPQEQYYTKGNQGPWTDIYSLCATMYKMLTGTVPPNCIERMSEDSYIPPSQCGVTVSPQVEAALNKGLSVNISDRYQNIGELIKDLYGKEYTFMGDGQIGVASNITLEDNSTSKDHKNKKMIGIIAGFVATFLVIVICVRTFFIDSDQSKATDADTSSQTATLTDVSITETTEVSTEESTLEGEWSDFKFMVDDVCYELPMTYAEWTSCGWIPDMNMTVLPGEIVGVRFHNDKMSCSVELANYNTETVSMEQCHVISFCFYYDYYGTKEECIITLPSNIKINTKNYGKSSDLETALDIYGRAGYENIGELFSVCEWSTEDGSYLELYEGDDGGIQEVDITCYKKPNDASITPGERVEQVPYEEEYENIGDTADRFDDIFNIDGINYKMWCPVSKFVDNGWTIECEQATVASGTATWAILKKGDASIEVRVGNTTVYCLDISQTRVLDIKFNYDNSQDISVIMPGGVALGGNSSDTDYLYSDLDCFKEIIFEDRCRHSVYNYGVADGCISIEVVSYKPDEESEEYIIKEYTYERSFSASKADLDNVDYIKNLTVE